jgi:hypothetical protein
VTRALLALALLARLAAAQPATVLYQGFLADSGGDAVNATTDMTFRLYATETGGSPLWEETVPDIAVASGSFAVELGLDAADLTQDDLWLAVVLDDELPRQRVGSAPFAMLCGAAQTLGGLPPSSYQASVTGSCPPGEAIRAINVNGTVACDPDAANVVTSVTPGDGLLGSTPLTGSVSIDLNLGEGLQLNGGAVDVVYAGFGLNEAARSDHGHAGTYLALGLFTACGPGDRMTGFDPGTGDVLCAPDVDNVYSPGPSGNLVLDPMNNFYTAANITIPGTLYADNYQLQAPQTTTITMHASDFDPEYSGFGDWQVNQSGGGYGALEVANVVNVYAPLPIPYGSTVTEINFTYENPDAVSGDQIGCFFHSTDLFGGPGPGSGAGGFAPPTVVITTATFPVVPSAPVDQSNFTYETRCYLNDGGAVIGDVRLYSVQVTYTNTLLF